MPESLSRNGKTVLIWCWLTCPVPVWASFKDPKPLDGLPAVQKGILENVSRYVRPGGVLLYSTCTLRGRENENLIEEFLRAHPDFAPDTFELPQPVGIADGMLTLWPHIHGTDGFFIAKLRRKA